MKIKSEMKKTLLSDEKNKKCGTSSSVSCELIIKCPQQGFNPQNAPNVPVLGNPSIYISFSNISCKVLIYVYISAKFEHKL